MSDIYVFGPHEESNDYSTMGLVGALEPTVCQFKETGNGESIVSMEHPLDLYGKHTALQKGNILVVPVPVRTTPEIENTAVVTTVWTYKVKPASQLTSKYQRALYKKKTGSSRKKIMNSGDIVTVVQMPEGDDARWKVKSPYGNGWINPDGFELVTEHRLKDDPHAIEEIQSPWNVTDQLFRIYKRTATLDSIKVEARHISYDLLYNMSNYSSEKAVKLQDALNGILENCFGTHEFAAHTNVASELAGLRYEMTNPIDAFINPENGICETFNVGMIRDNYDLYFLNEPGMNRGVRIAYRKNMLGVTYEESDDEVVTRIVPTGKTKDDETLFLTDSGKGEGCYLDFLDYVSETDKVLYENAYPIPHVYKLECENCKVGEEEENGGKITKAVARERMKAQAEKLFEEGCYLPKVTVKVEFVNLGDTEEYKQFRNLENCYLFDYVLVQANKIGVDIIAQIASITWDCILDRMESCEIGSAGMTMANSGITTWQIPNGFSGSKIAYGTIGSGALMPDIIGAKHIQAGSILAEAIAAESITAEKIAAGAITADRIDAESLKATVAEFVELTVEYLKADDIDTDRLTADIVEAIQVTAGTAYFDRATVEHLVASALNLEFGVGERVFIKNLAVAYAQVISATIGNLCIKASNGNYYAIDVTEDGKVTATLATVSEDEALAGMTDAGRVILGTDILAENLNASNVLAVYALVNQIDAARIDVDQLFAREAFINRLTTQEIIGGKSLTMIAGDVSAAEQAALNTAHIFRQDDAPTNEDGVKPNDLWVCTTDGLTYQAVESKEAGIRFAVDDEGNLTYTLDADSPIKEGDLAIDENGNLILSSESIGLYIDDDGYIFEGVAWVLVQDEELLERIGLIEDEIETIRTDTEEYVDTVLEDLTTQIDGKAETWFYKVNPLPNNVDENGMSGSNEPAVNWIQGDIDKEDNKHSLKNNHVGDLYYNTDSNTAWRWTSVTENDTTSWFWVAIRDQDAIDALDKIADTEAALDGKMTVFTSTPAVPYHEGDLWAQGEDGDLLVCKVTRTTGSYTASDWGPASKYATAQEIEDYVEAITDNLSDELMNQIDGKAETWFYKVDPTTSNVPASTWTSAELKEKHVGDLYYNTDNNTAWRWADNYTWVRIRDADTIDALDKIADTEAALDGKTTVFMDIPLSPYHKGDLWLQGEDGDIFMCTTTMETAGYFIESHWALASKYGNISLDEVYAAIDTNSIHVSDTKPTVTPVDGKIWLDTGVTPAIFRRYDATNAEWDVVNDSEELENALDLLKTQQANEQAEIDKLNTIVKEDSEGVHVGKDGVNGTEVLVAYDSVNIKNGGKVISKFAANFLEFMGEGGMRMFKPATGGMAFVPKGD